MIARRSDKKWKSSNESGKKSTRQACLNLHAMYIFLVLSFSGFVYDAIVRWSNCWLSNSDVGIVHVQFCICLSCFWYVWTAEPNWFQKRDTSKAASIKFIYLCNSYTYYIYIYVYIYIHLYIYTHIYIHISISIYVLYCYHMYMYVYRKLMRIAIELPFNFWFQPLQTADPDRSRHRPRCDQPKRPAGTDPWNFSADFTMENRVKRGFYHQT